MRKWIPVLMLAFATTTVATTAHAKKPKKEKKAKEAGPVKLEILMTDVEGIDKVFKKAASPIDKINSANEKITKSRADLNTALGLSESTPFKEAITELKTKAGDIKLTMDGAVPTLGASAAAGDDVKKAIEAANATVKASAGAVKALATLPKDIAALITEAQTLADPAKLKEIATGVPPTKLIKLPKTIKANIKTLGAAKDAVSNLATTSTGMVNDIKSTFGG